MNNLKFSATIIKMKNYQTNLSIICQNNPFPGKTARFSVNVTGENKKEWENKLIEGDLITISGEIAEAKQNNYGAYIAVWNPIIHEAKRIKSEMIDISDYDESSEGLC